MAKLFTHHDRFHVHAILGLTALLHFVYRFGYHFFSLGTESFDPSAISALGLMVHALLHATSFQFFLPTQRNWTKPMIWREFRVHNAIFAVRNLVGAALGIWFPVFWWRQPPVVSVMIKVGVVVGTSYLADVATQMVGSREKRTTNAMPYPSNTPKTLEKMVKVFYAKSQFAATALAAFGPPILSFSSVLAIELASILMTLVRKNKIEVRTYHAVYTAALFIMFPAMFFTIHSADAEAGYGVWRAMSATAVACILRLEMSWGKYTTWIASILSGPLFAAVIDMVLPFKWAAWLGALWSLSDTVLAYVRCRAAERTSTTSETSMRDTDPLHVAMKDAETTEMSTDTGKSGTDAKSDTDTSTKDAETIKSESDTTKSDVGSSKSDTGSTKSE